ncbi:MAG: hypothetical protein C6W57_05150 [Caldibacillus debilis]|nr:MAG: hypothetical protein C6W57_05150 [Caldibacillus debilis]REJ31163.1 MAG: hypothetical protein C6W56_00075 [Caldibacillus debilis]
MESHPKRTARPVRLPAEKCGADAMPCVPGYHFPSPARIGKGIAVRIRSRIGMRRGPIRKWQPKSPCGYVAGSGRIPSSGCGCIFRNEQDPMHTKGSPRR